MTVKPTEPTKETKKAYFYEYKGDEDVDLSSLELKKKKPLNVTLNNTSGSSKNFSSSDYSEIITIEAGAYSMTLSGTNSDKTVKLGDTSGNIVHFSNIGKNKLIAGAGGNEYYSDSAYSNNTITAGKAKDTYNLKSGTTKITDNGGDNKYNIYGGINTITDKGLDGSTFNIYHRLSNDGGITTIKAGGGKDFLNVYNDNNPRNPQIITADLGKGDDEVLVGYDTDPQSDNKNVSTLNLKTGKGEDKVEIYAGKKNYIETGDDKDTITVYYTGNDLEHPMQNIIKAGKGDDIITINDGINTIYGEGGTDEINIIAKGINTIYGGGDKINVVTNFSSVENTIYAYSDKININNGENTIYTKKGKNSITLTGGTNTIYASGSDIINSNGASGNNTIYVKSDTINLTAGANNVYAQKGGSTINILSNDIMTDNDNNYIYLQKGNNTVNLHGGESANYTYVKTEITAGKNTFNLYDYTALDGYGDANYKTAQTLIIQDYAYADIDLGSGADVIRDSSLVTVPDQWEVNGGKGNDKFYISNGKNKHYNGQDGNDYFELTNGTSYTVDGGNGKDTFIVTGGEECIIYGREGNDVVTINSGEKHAFHGGDGIDTITINDGVKITVNGANGNDIINIKGGSEHIIDGGYDDDVYNISKGSSTNLSTNIADADGKNKYNIKKGYAGKVIINDTSNSSNVIFEDKSLKLSSSQNVNTDHSISTNSKILSIWGNYLFSTITEGISQEDGHFGSDGISLVYDLASEISDTDKAINGNYIGIKTPENKTNYVINGKKYALDLDQLKYDLDQWNIANGGNNFTTKSVLENGDDAQIKSLLAVFTQDTAECFVKV